MRDIKPVTDDELRAALRQFPASPRCPTCGRVVTARFQSLGLGVIEYERVETSESVEIRMNAHHTYPCVGLPVRLKPLLRELVKIVNAASAPDQEETPHG